MAVPSLELAGRNPRPVRPAPCPGQCPAFPCPAPGSDRRRAPDPASADPSVAWTAGPAGPVSARPPTPVDGSGRQPPRRPILAMAMVGRVGGGRDRGPGAGLRRPYLRGPDVLHPVGFDAAHPAGRRPDRGRQAELPPPRRPTGATWWSSAARPWSRPPTPTWSSGSSGFPGDTMCQCGRPGLHRRQAPGTSPGCPAGADDLTEPGAPGLQPQPPLHRPGR